MGYPEGVRIQYVIERYGPATNRLLRYVTGSLPPHFWEDAAHVRYEPDGRIREMLCMHGGSMYDCIAQADEHLAELYAQDDPVWLEELKLKKREKARPIRLTKRFSRYTKEYTDREIDELLAS